MSCEWRGGDHPLKLGQHPAPIREIKRAKTSTIEDKSSSIVDVDAIVDEVLRDDVEQFELRSTPENFDGSKGQKQVQIEIKSDLSDLSEHYDVQVEDGAQYIDGDDSVGFDHDKGSAESLLGTDDDGEGEESEFAHTSTTTTPINNDNYIVNGIVDRESSVTLHSADDIVQEIIRLGPNLFVQQQIREGQSPEDILKILGYPLSEGLSHADYSGLSSLQDVVDLLERSHKIMIVTGAGISVSCGIPDFRSENGLYARIQDKYALPEPECMFDIEFFRIDPEPFYTFARELLPHDEYKPSFSHYFIADLDQRGQLLRQYTQNIDTLEEDAGIKNVVYCHGSFSTASCLECYREFNLGQFKELIQDETVPYCDECSGLIKPNIVFFGEPLPKSFDEHLELDCGETDLVLVIGSSLKVHPVSSIPDLIPPNVPQILINRESLDHNFDIELLGDCDMILAELFRRLNRSFSDPSSRGRFADLNKTPVESCFIDPIYHIFPGAKPTHHLSAMMPKSANMTSIVLSEERKTDSDLNSDSEPTLGLYTGALPSDEVPLGLPESQSEIIFLPEHEDLNLIP